MESGRTYIVATVKKRKDWRRCLNSRRYSLNKKTRKVRGDRVRCVLATFRIQTEHAKIASTRAKQTTVHTTYD